MDITSTFAALGAAAPKPPSSFSGPNHKDVSGPGGERTVRADIDQLLLQEAYTIDQEISKICRFMVAVRPAYLALPAGQISKGRFPRPKEAERAGAVGGAGPDMFEARPAGAGRGRPDTAAAPLSEKERRQIDGNTAMRLKTLSLSIQTLGKKASLDVNRQVTEAAAKQGGRVLSSLANWASGMRAGAGGGGGSGRSVEEDVVEEALTTFWKSVTAYLQDGVRQVSALHGQMLAVWEEREMERAKTKRMRDVPFTGRLQPRHGRGGGAVDLLRSVNSTGLNSVEVPAESRAGPGGQEELPDRLQQAFERENEGMLLESSQELEQLRETQETIIEISRLQAMGITEYQKQEEKISMILNESVAIEGNIQMGNQQLDEAKKRPSSARALFWATCGLCTTLVVWDLIF